MKVHYDKGAAVATTTRATGTATRGRELLVGLDLGTTSSKAVVFDTDGRAFAVGRAPTRWTRTSTGAEIDPAALLDGALEALVAAAEAAPEGTIVGVGIASIGESGVLVDGAGSALAPAIAWHDTRDTDQLASLLDALGGRTFAEQTGLPLRQQWSLTKHRWLLDHHEPARRAVRRFNVADWVVRGLGGEEGSEQSLASRTGWLDVHRRQWWDEALEWSGAHSTLMPDLVTAGTPLGRLTGELGLERLAGAVLTPCGHDHQVAAVGAGAVRAGDQLDSCGTAEALVRSVEPGLPPEVVGRLADGLATVGWHALADRWCLLGATEGGLYLGQVLDSLGVTREDTEALNAEALAVAAVAAGTTRGRAWAEAVEQVTREVAAIDAAMSEVTGPAGTLFVVGGWSHHEALMAAKRRHFGKVHVPQVDEAGARGAALFAGLAAGVYGSPAEFPRP